ncbi:MAG: phosphoenolpyruvate--protein phosphotransferase [Planctomycetes bacterium]|nr:phosphoenolpyruvate--protein phosphotransferase [Planctomycetota bacterium]
MITHYGIPASPGVAIGEALIFDKERIRIPRRFVTRDAVDDEVRRLEQAIDAVAAEIDRNRELVTGQLGAQYGAIFAAHLAMLRDPRLNEEWRRLIREQHYAPEHAVSETLRRYASVFQKLEHRFLAARSEDVLDIERSLLRCLTGQPREELTHIGSPVAVLAHDLTPSETASLDRRFVIGFATESGGAGGHSAIVARALEIPAVVGLGRFLAETGPGDAVIIDGDEGRLIVRPDGPTRAEFERRAESRRTFAASLERFRDLPAETADGTRIEIDANIEFPHEVDACRQRGADGIGLYRTEFLYLGAAREPTEDDHFRAYADVVERMGGRPVVIRTFDLGADKLGRAPGESEERNPFLGLRSIRISLRHVTEFRRQLRAILRAGASGDVRVMFPMIATVPELRRAKAILADACEDLDEAGIPRPPKMPVGMMVEVPSAVVLLDRFLPDVDFVSIGTNDLIQYALAVDRCNREVADLYHDTDPAVLKLIAMTVDAAERHGKPVGLCGQMSANPLCTPLLIGLGLRSLSMPPADIPEIKQICRGTTVERCREVAGRALRMESARQVDHYLREEFQKNRT